MEKIKDVWEFLNSNQDQACLFYLLRIKNFKVESDLLTEFLSLPEVSENLFI